MPSRPRSCLSRLKGRSGAFDLPSVLIGVAVVAILAIGVMATIFGVIPWAQVTSRDRFAGPAFPSAKLPKFRAA